jgi:Schlafen group 3, DNA/RNA helicase domain
MSKVVKNSGLARAWYAAAIRDFVRADCQTILGNLAENCDTEILTTQREAWLSQIDILRKQLGDLNGWVFFEFNIPRMGRRVDVILVIGPAIFALEFKVGEKTYDHTAIEQVWDYALDLKNFHEASHNVAIAPILVATEARPGHIKFEADADNVYRPIGTNSENLLPTLKLALSAIKGSALDAEAWARASYKPTPTIIEAARALYAQHSVEAIARFDAGTQNLHTTSKRIEALVDEARSTGQKYICFVTGVPGAGKTLVGLNIATQRRDETAPTHAVFLSGNGPLVTVLREALTGDEFFRMKARGERVTKKKVATPVKAFIQNVHHFRDAGLMD